MTHAASFTPQTVAQILALGIVTLAKATQSARADASILMAFALGRDREWLIAHGETFLTKPQAEKFAALCEVRATGMPVAYIIGSAWFYGREFNVSDKVLIPRPETEHLVDEAVERLRARANPDWPKALLTVLDVGVGSGAIGCSIAAEVPNAAIEATDTSQAALKIAEHNARRLHVFNRCRFYLGNLAEPVSARAYDVVVANLPYVPTADIPLPPDPVGFEPREALDGGPDGLDTYRRFAPVLPRLLKPGGLALMEAAPPVMDGLVELVRAAFPQAQVEVRSDYGGQARYVWVQAPGR
jgi:release factor glutamine methyltransferase